MSIGCSVAPSTPAAAVVHPWHGQYCSTQRDRGTCQLRRSGTGPPACAGLMSCCLETPEAAARPSPCTQLRRRRHLPMTPRMQLRTACPAPGAHFGRCSSQLADGSRTCSLCVSLELGDSWPHTGMLQVVCRGDNYTMLLLAGGHSDSVSQQNYLIVAVRWSRQVLSWVQLPLLFLAARRHDDSHDGACGLVGEWDVSCMVSKKRRPPQTPAPPLVCGRRLRHRRSSIVSTPHLPQPSCALDSTLAATSKHGHGHHHGVWQQSISEELV